MRIWLNDRLVLDKWNARGLQFYSVEAPFEAGRKMPVKIEYINKTGAAACMLVSDFGNSDQIDKVKEFVSGADLVLGMMKSWLVKIVTCLPFIYL